MNAIEAALAGLIDYAGLYPPASLDMRAAVGNYSRAIEPANTRLHSGPVHRRHEAHR